MSHTPGPWEFRKAGSVTFRGNDGKERTEGYPPHVVSVRRDDQGRKCTAYVAVCSATTLPNEANARLIAAAPELLEALKKMVEHYGDPAQGAIAGARAAIAKAEACS